MSLNNEPCMVRPVINRVKLIYFPCSGSFHDKCSGSCHAASDIAAKICVTSKTKDINV